MYNYKAGRQAAVGKILQVQYTISELYSITSILIAWAKSQSFANGLCTLTTINVTVLNTNYYNLVYSKAINKTQDTKVA